jgi:tRNA dimethylallyltransferase
MPMSFPARLDAWYVTGPTASGKSAVGAELAARINAEVLSLDSMAVYRGMDIGTAKWRVSDDRRGKPGGSLAGGSPGEHLIDLVDPDQEFSLAEYVAAAHRAIDDIQSRGRTALFVGGTPLYLKALLRGLFVGPEPDWPLRRELHEMAQRGGAEAVHRRLADADPVAAGRLHPNNLRRVIRAIEVFEGTGRAISEHQKQFEVAHTADECRVVVLDWPRSRLNERIERRVDAMFAAGWVEEVRRLTGEHKLGRTASQAVGYGEIIEHLEGKIDLATTIERVKKRTRQFAKRQLTWFRSLPECRWLAMRDDEPAAATAERIVVTVCGQTV